jgi:hypothetical protein
MIKYLDENQKLFIEARARGFMRFSFTPESPYLAPTDDDTSHQSEIGKQLLSLSHFFFITILHLQDCH